MEITEVRIYPKEIASDRKLKAFATITIDNSLVIRDIKIIEGKKGFFVAMPSSKMSVPCSYCHKKNPVGIRFCGNCGKAVEQVLEQNDEEKRESHRDIAHPINSKTRDYLHTMVMEAYYKQKTSKFKHTSNSDDYELYGEEE